MNPGSDGGTVVTPPDGGTDAGTSARRPAPNPIPGENLQHGDPGWRSGRQANAGEVEVYASLDSAEAGDVVSVKVSTDVDARVTAQVYRLGYYGGAGARRIWSGGPFATHKQAACPRDPVTSRVECHWEDTFSFRVGADWVSGVYVVKVMRPDGFKRFAPMVVRDRRSAELLMQPGFNTYQAYNAWGGESLYADASGAMSSGRAFEVSYDRPYRDSDGVGHLFYWDLPFLSFLERNGYDVTYGSNLDFARFPRFLDGIGALVIAGHDEYWTAQEREQVDAAIASGRTSFAYFGGNGAYWRVRPAPNQDGTPFRTLICYKGDSPTRDPIPNSTIRFRDDPNPQPESLLFGSMYDGWQVVAFPLIVKDPGHWLFEGTNVVQGEKLLGLLGYEFDRVPPSGSPVSGLNVSFESPLVTAEGLPDVSHVVDHTAPSGRLVFSAGSIYWALGLSADPEVHDGRVERMTLNVLERALSHRRPARALEPATGPKPSEPNPDPCWVESVAAYAGTAGTLGWADGPGNAARFSGPTGLALMPDGKLVVADTGNQRIRLIDVDPAHTVTTVAGNGQLGFRDGPGAQAMFRSPTGVAVGPDGAIYVADSDNHAIRRIAHDAPNWSVTTYAGGMRIQGDADGPGDQARFRRPTALAFDAQGNLYVADQAGNRIRKISPSREVTTIAGNASPGFADAAQGLQARFNNPSAITVAPTGALYVLDSANQKLRRISMDAAHAVTTIAGADLPGFADGNGRVARFRAQMGLAVAPDGALVLGDTGNFRLRKVLAGADAAATSVYTLAGSGQVGHRLGRGDQADLVAPTGIAYGPGGILYVSDSYNHAIRVIAR